MNLKNRHFLTFILEHNCLTKVDPLPNLLAFKENEGKFYHWKLPLSENFKILQNDLYWHNSDKECPQLV